MLFAFYKSCYKTGGLLLSIVLNITPYNLSYFPHLDIFANTVEKCAVVVGTKYTICSSMYEDATDYMIIMLVLNSVVNPLAIRSLYFAFNSLLFSISYVNCYYDDFNVLCCSVSGVSAVYVHFILHHLHLDFTRTEPHYATPSHHPILGICHSSCTV